MWTVPGTILENPSDLGTFEPVEVLDEHEHPIIFVCEDSIGNLLLMHNTSASQNTLRFIAAAFDENLLRRLKKGYIDLAGALNQPRTWVVDLSYDWDIQTVWSLRIKDIPDKILPRKGVMLHPSLEPMFRIRLVGGHLGEGKTSSDDIQKGSQVVEDALKRTAEIALAEERRRGRTSARVKHFANPPLLALAHQSLEMAFGAPLVDTPNEAKSDRATIDRMGVLLNAGIAGANGDFSSLEKLELSIEDQISLLEAVRKLTPTTDSGVSDIFVSGQMISSTLQTRHLTGASRKRAGERIKTLRNQNEDPAIVHFAAIGHITRLNLEDMVFGLRLVEPIRTITPQVDPLYNERFPFDTVIEFAYPLEMTDEIKRSLTNELIVSVIAVHVIPEKPAGEYNKVYRFHTVLDED